MLDPSSLRRWFGRSLLRRLWLGMTALITALALSTTAAAYLFGYQEARELQDVQLRQIASLVVRWRDLPQSVLEPQGADVDDDARIIVERLDTASAASADGLQLPRDLPTGMHLVRSAGSDWRVFVQAAATGRIAVAQRTEVRTDAAVSSAQRAVFPLLALIPLLALLCAWVVNRTLQPVRVLADQVDARNEDSLDPLPVGEVPREIRPFLASINRLLERLAVLLQRERRFIADAAHELRTPIAALGLQVENLSHALPAESRDRLRSVQQGLARTRAVVEQLLNLAHAQSGHGTTASPIDPTLVMRQVIEDLMPLAERRHIDLGIARDEGAPLRADATQLYTLLRNGLDNALRHTPEGGRVDLMVFTEDSADGIKRVNLDICDSGPGIPPEDLERAFQPFERLSTDAAESGSGLGLAIMRTLAQRLGGRVELTNLPAGGLRVRYSQPAG